jgi:diguanylate cyclase (GGDEF)-like protein
VGGDEFAVIFNSLGPEQAAAVVERIRQSAAHTVEDPSGGVAIRVTASAGYVTLEPGTRLTPPEAMAAADRFLRQAKERGRDRTVGEPYAVGEEPGSQ